MTPLVLHLFLARRGNSHFRSRKPYPFLGFDEVVVTGAPYVRGVYYFLPP